LIYSKIGDSPERLLYRKVDLSIDNWNKWVAGPEFELLTVKNNLEGIDISIKPSIKGASIEKIHDLRDPSVSQDIDKKTYLLYSGKGEKEIGLAEIKFNN
tara:strand:+ start:141 stop:440 length:300 start_codon:yes stop_codon:yes gene_type:complete